MPDSSKPWLQRVCSLLLGRPEVNGKGADLDHLTRLARRFCVEQQQVPRDLDDLVTLKYLQSVPTPPPGQKFVVDRTTVEVRLEQR